MVFSELFLALPYRLIWNLVHIFQRQKSVHFYAAEELDYVVFKNVHKLIPKVQIVASNKNLISILKNNYNIESLLYPTFPDLILMARHSLHKYPTNKILKIGMRHGPYHFKDFIGPEKYNRFDLFLLTSESEVKEARDIGIVKSISGGFPKSDDLYDPKKMIEAEIIKNEIFPNNKKTILFSSTWDKSGISSVNYWASELNRFTEKYNVLVTVHSWTNKDLIRKIKQTKLVYFIDSKDLNLYLHMTDCLISDTSSLIAEFMLLDRPIITFEIPAQKRLSENIVKMLEQTTYRIKQLDELSLTLETAFGSYIKNSEIRYKFIELMFNKNLGKHSLIASNIIKEFANENKILI